MQPLPFNPAREMRSGTSGLGGIAGREFLRGGLTAANEKIRSGNYSADQASQLRQFGGNYDAGQKQRAADRVTKTLLDRGKISRSEADDRFRSSRRELQRTSERLKQQQSAPAGNRPPTQASGIRARGPGDPPDIAAPRTRQQRERDIVIQQQGGRSMTAGRANSESEQRLADALNSGLRKSGQLEQARVAMNAERGRNAGQIPARFSPNAGQMVAGRVQSTGATGGGFGSGQGGPNPGAIGYRTNSVMNPPGPAMARPPAPAAGNQRAQSQEDVIRQFQQQRGFDPREMMKRGGRGDRSPIYI